jgi:hypothetical protein
VLTELGIAEMWAGRLDDAEWDLERALVDARRRCDADEPSGIPGHQVIFPLGRRPNVAVPHARTREPIGAGAARVEQHRTAPLTGGRWPRPGHRHRPLDGCA